MVWGLVVDGGHQWWEVMWGWNNFCDAIGIEVPIEAKPHAFSWVQNAATCLKTIMPEV